MRRLPPQAARLPALSALLLGAAIVLPACTSTQDVLEPSALVGDGAANPLPQAEFPLSETTAEEPAAAQQPQAPVAAITTSARVQFAPVVGATAEASTPLAARLAARARDRGIGLVGAGDGGATHILKGYFSAISDDGETTVIYVWDVMDPAGTRIHRIQGQAKSAAGGDGWSSVQSATMEAIADQTVDQLAAWLVSRQG